MASWRPFSSRSAAACPPQAARGLIPILFPALGNGTETLMSLEEVNQTGNKPTWVCGLVEEFWKTFHPLGRHVWYNHDQQFFTLSLVGEAGGEDFQMNLKLREQVGCDSERLLDKGWWWCKRSFGQDFLGQGQSQGTLFLDGIDIFSESSTASPF